ncbi:MAG TPA: S24 family peptidase, partial [Verrucomicrobiae bacterium]|nr:S24 family peptidase [Verrucomicrobiae bacterium]
DFERRKARSLRINSPLVKLRVQVVDVPLFGSIPAGFASSREQAAEGCISIDINSIGFKPTAYTFALRVKGDSMIGRHIVSGDIAIFDQAQEPLHGDIVAALVDGQSTLKTYFLRDGKPFLKAENPNYPDQAPAEELVIQGVLKAIIRGA